MIQTGNPNAFDDAKGCGQVLREARQTAGLTVQDVGVRLKMPAHVIEALENEQWGKLGASVFVRGQLRSYARLLGVDLESLLQKAQIATPEPVELVSHTHVPRYRRVLESAARRAVYVVITAAIAVPVWLATRSPMDADAPGTASLDVAPPPSAAADGVPAALPPRGSEPPVVASLAPLSRAAVQEPAPQTQADLLLRFNGESWMQATAPDGRSLEQGLMQPGDERAFRAGEVGRIVLGNAAAVEVQQAGSTVDLTPYRRANVARFAVSSDGSVAPASD